MWLVWCCLCCDAFPTLTCTYLLWITDCQQNDCHNATIFHIEGISWNNQCYFMQPWWNWKHFIRILSNISVTQRFLRYWLCWSPPYVNLIKVWGHWENIFKTTGSVRRSHYGLRRSQSTHLAIPKYHKITSSIQIYEVCLLFSKPLLSDTDMTDRSGWTCMTRFLSLAQFGSLLFSSCPYRKDGYVFLAPSVLSVKSPFLPCCFSSQMTRSLDLGNVLPSGGNWTLRVLLLLFSELSD